MLYHERFFRNMPALSARQQAECRKSRFCVVGLGGTGGFALECLLRMGAERIALFDHDRFELGNFNRQLLATDATLDGRKADAAAARARSINPSSKIKKSGAFDSGAKCARALGSSDVVLDCTDRLSTKLAVWKACRKLRIPYVFCSAQGSRGMVSVFSGYSMERAFQVDGGKLAPKSCASALCPAAALAGTLAASEALNSVLGKPVVRAPRALFFDIFDRRVSWMGRLG
jgi:molybdopterin/thiamine biosynthesis adenylyltransferase